MTPAISRRRTKTWDDSQPDLFIALPSDIPARDQQDLMERPFFSLSKNKRTTPIEYKVGENYIRVTAPVEYGMGGPSYSIKAEFNDHPHVRGAVSMARAQDPDSAGSQFFLMVKEVSALNGKYTVFGEVVMGMEVADRIVSQPRDARDNPLERIEMRVRILE